MNKNAHKNLLILLGYNGVVGYVLVNLNKRNLTGSKIYIPEEDISFSHVVLLKRIEL